MLWKRSFTGGGEAQAPPDCTPRALCPPGPPRQPHGGKPASSLHLFYTKDIYFLPAIFFSFLKNRIIVVDYYRRPHPTPIFIFFCANPFLPPIPHLRLGEHLHKPRFPARGQRPPPRLVRLVRPHRTGRDGFPGLHRLRVQRLLHFREGLGRGTRCLHSGAVRRTVGADTLDFP